MPNKCYKLLTLMFIVLTNIQKYTYTHTHTHVHTYTLDVYLFVMHTNSSAFIAREKKGTFKSTITLPLKSLHFIFWQLKLIGHQNGESPTHTTQWKSACTFICIERILWIILFYHCFMLSMSCNAYKSHILKVFSDKMLQMIIRIHDCIYLHGRIS